MKEKRKKFSEKMKNIGGKISGIKGITAIIPAVCLAVLMITVLTGYQTPKAKKYNAAETDISQIKEALANESTAVKATAATTKKNATKKGKKGTIDLKDGTYKGSANGYGGKVTVNVTVSKKTMTAIDIVSAPGETDSFFSRAKGVIDEMLTAQSTDVDVVSGATYSSNGIIGAVKNALYGTESTNATAASANSNAGGSAPSVSKVKESGNWKDGTYTGSGKGFGGNISVKVTIKDGKISSINVTSASGETASYFSKAKGIISKMISKQTTNVDVASGATYSSNGIIKAVRNALSKAGGKTSTKKTSKKKKDSKSNNKNNTTAPKEGYEDGTYTGTAACSGEQFKEYSVTANVTIKNGKISAVEISSTAKGTNLKQFMSREEIKNLPSLIISKNGTSGVDVVSGATYSSNAIFNAVNNALAKAKKGSSSTKKEETTTAKKEETTTEKKEETTTEKKEETTTEKKEDTTTEADPDDGEVYKNGTYKVSVTCEPDEDEDFDAYTISMEVTIKKDKITDISNITANTNSSNKAYTNTAKKGMVSKITAKGTADGVDTVSGATCSSKAIKEGCQKAFDAARK
nr:FMN-binding protein [uncultured Anaerobutyricum sp.]